MLQRKETQDTGDQKEKKEDGEETEKCQEGADRTAGGDEEIFHTDFRF